MIDEDGDYRMTMACRLRLNGWKLCWILSEISHFIFYMNSSLKSMRHERKIPALSSSNFQSTIVSSSQNLKPYGLSYHFIHSSY